VTLISQRIPLGILAAAMLLAGVTGCHDGPLYGLKVANPFYSMHQWKQDEDIGPTDHQRLKEMRRLVAVMPSLPEDRQAAWFTHLRGIMDHDSSPEMRRLAVIAAGNTQLSGSSELIGRGLKDDSLKVRLAACHVLGERGDEASARVLAETAGSTSDADVRNAALAALGQHSGKIAVDALKLALDTRDPATRDLAIASLRGATGKDYGDDPEVWIAALDGKDVPEKQTQIADRLRELWR
jgi:hypothetical protein